MPGADDQVVFVDADNLAEAVGSLRRAMNWIPTVASMVDAPDLDNSGTELLVATSAMVSALPTALAAQFESICQTVLTHTIAAVEADAIETGETLEEVWYGRCEA